MAPCLAPSVVVVWCRPPLVSAGSSRVQTPPLRLVQRSVERRLSKTSSRPSEKGGWNASPPVSALVSRICANRRSLSREICSQCPIQQTRLVPLDEVENGLATATWITEPEGIDEMFDALEQVLRSIPQ